MTCLSSLQRRLEERDQEMEEVVKMHQAEFGRRTAEQTRMEQDAIKNAAHLLIDETVERDDATEAEAIGFTFAKLATKFQKLSRSGALTLFIKLTVEAVDELQCCADELQEMNQVKKEEKKIRFSFLSLYPISKSISCECDVDISRL
tara:strand:+ start:893 stop:1333 length:441 start_codon:yes stop_codon:yes gene_type:complete